MRENGKILEGFQSHNNAEAPSGQLFFVVFVAGAGGFDFGFDFRAGLSHLDSAVASAERIAGPPE